MRIVGGKWRGRALANVGKGDDANRLRPTSDRVRESLFNVLAHGPYPGIAQARILDLFAGTGALGFESLSRGAEHVTFVEKGRIGQSIIRSNIKLLNCSDESSLLPRDATRLGKNDGPVFDICFLDPPYGKGMGEAALASAVSGGWFGAGTLIVLEEGQSVHLPEDFKLAEVRKYGDTHIHIGTFTGS